MLNFEHERDIFAFNIMFVKYKEEKNLFNVNSISCVVPFRILL